MARSLMIMVAECGWWCYSSAVFRRLAAREEMGSGDVLRQPPWWFLSLAVLGAVFLGAGALRLLVHLVLLLRRPTDLRRRYGAWAVVTGPTSGIGRSFALELARRGLNLVLVGRDPAKLRDVSDAVSAAHAVQTKTVEFDFSLVGTVEGDETMLRLRKTVEGLDVGVLVSNAGVATPFAVYLHEADVEAWVHRAHGAGEHVGADAGDRRGAAGDGGAGAARRRQHRLRLQRGPPVVPALRRLLRLQTVAQGAKEDLKFYARILEKVAREVFGARRSWKSWTLRLAN